mgnify:CR=1 FL=1|tara:strand:+ start:1492 stop:2028 length:537 start_codon:yes stop_codon:yes gene_type:complete
MSKNLLKKYYVTNPNFISIYYFLFIYYLISKITNFNNKKILDYGGGQGFLKQYLKKKYKCNIRIFDIIDKFSELKNWKSFNFDIIIFCQVVCLLKKNEFNEIIKFLKKKRKIQIITAFSKQTFINKLFAVILGHKDAHDGTLTPPEIEKKTFLKNFSIMKKYNFYVFEVLLLRQSRKR